MGQMILNDLFSGYSSYTPPRKQLLKWVGSKHRSAIEITNWFPSKFNTYFEPFLGSGSILATLSPRKAFGSDVFSPLIEIWMKLKSDPDGLVKWYSDRRCRLEFEDKESVYESIRASYNVSPNGPDFLMLSRMCYGGIIRFRKADGYMSTPCGTHTPISVGAFASRVDSWKRRVENTDFFIADFSVAFDLAKEGDLIYCDPPYSHSQGILYGAQDFNLDRLLSKIAEAKGRGVKVALSIDGSKDNGNYKLPLPIPEGLFHREIDIQLGKSMLKRLQTSGVQSDETRVSDRLLLTY